MRYDPEHVATAYDAYGDREWERFDASLAARVNLALHERFLVRHVPAGSHVLDVGCGPGRFTIQLAAAGCTVHAVDISQEMLRQHEQRVAAAGFADAVTARARGDVVDLAGVPDDSVDAVVCFGGPLSYALDRAGDAVRSLLRVLRPGGVVVASVMSVVGATREGLPGVLSLARERGEAPIRRIVETGDLPASFTGWHRLRMYRHAELVALVTEHGGRVLDSSASGVLAPDGLTPGGPLAVLDDADLALLLDLDEACSREPGALDVGTHVLVAFAHAG